MQIYALDHANRSVHAASAKKQRDYFCRECGRCLRLRSGPYCRPHFYHLDPPLHCRQHKKSATHLQLQCYLQRMLPNGESRLEYRIPSIGRVADVAWLPQKIIFEIQCSAISESEVNSRHQDYLQAGWHVVWVLHEKRFYQRKQGDWQRSIFRSYPHYFTDMNQEGIGKIYDRFNLQVDLAFPKDQEKALDSQAQSASSGLHLVKERLLIWPLYFRGDLVDLALRDCLPSSILASIAQEQKTYKRSLLLLFQKPFHLLLRAYRFLFALMIEKSAR